MFSGLLEWNINEISKALNLSEEDTYLYFTDGRRVSFILERRLANEIIKGTLAPSEGAGYDLIDSDGNKWEVRSITKGGIYFCPSYMVGSGRHFNEDGFIKKTSEIKGFIVSDVTKFPRIPFWIISCIQVMKWWESGNLGNTTKISRDKALQLIKELK